MNSSAEVQFNRVARAYASSTVHARGADLEWLAVALQPKPSWRVLDAGTGAGHTAVTVAPHVASVTAVDWPSICWGWQPRWHHLGERPTSTSCAPA